MPNTQTEKGNAKKKERLGDEKSALGNERKLKLSRLIKGIISLKGIKDNESLPAAIKLLPALDEERKLTQIFWKRC